MLNVLVSGFGVLGLGFGVYGAKVVGSLVQGSGFRARCLGFEILRFLGLMVTWFGGLDLGVSGFWFEVQVLGSQYFVFRVSGVRLMVYGQ